MRFLGVGDCADLAALYLRLAEDGHEVKVFIGHPLCQDTLCGLIDRVTDWQGRARLGPERWSATAAFYSKMSAQVRGELQDRLRREGLQRDRQQRLWGAA